MYFNYYYIIIPDTDKKKYTYILSVAVWHLRCKRVLRNYYGFINRF